MDLNNSNLSTYCAYENNRITSSVLSHKPNKPLSLKGQHLNSSELLAVKISFLHYFTVPTGTYIIKLLLIIALQYQHRYKRFFQASDINQRPKCPFTLVCHLMNCIGKLLPEASNVKINFYHHHKPAPWFFCATKELQKSIKSLHLFLRHSQIFHTLPHSEANFHLITGFDLKDIFCILAIWDECIY